jgi:hypothetical protein
MDGSSQVFSLKEEEQPYQMVPRCWKSSDIRNVKQQERYLHTYVSMNVRFGEDSPLHQLINTMVVNSAKDLVSKGGSYWENHWVHTEIRCIIKQNFRVSIDAVVRSKAWLKFAYVRTGDSTIKNVSDVINSEFVHMTLKNLYNFFWQVTPKFLELEEHCSFGLECYSLQVPKGG